MFRYCCTVALVKLPAASLNEERDWINQTTKKESLDIMAWPVGLVK